VELEYLKRDAEAMRYFKRAVTFAEQNLGNSHILVEKLAGIQIKAQNKLDAKKK